MSALDRIFGTLTALAEDWKGEAARRRVLTAVDPAADVLEHCGTVLAAGLAELNAGTGNLTVIDVARLEHVTPQTVRGWIRRGELDATRTADGYRIPRSARRKRAA